MGQVCSTIFERVLASPLDRINPLSHHPRLSNQCSRPHEGGQPLPGHRPCSGCDHHRSLLLLSGAQIVPDRGDVQEHAAAVCCVHQVFTLHQFMN